MRRKEYGVRGYKDTHYHDWRDMEVSAFRHDCY